MSDDNVRQVFPLPHGEDGAWIAQARRVDRFVCEAVFRIEPSFHIGPESGGGSLDWEAANVRLPRWSLRASVRTR